MLDLVFWPLDDALCARRDRVSLRFGDTHSWKLLCLGVARLLSEAEVYRDG